MLPAVRASTASPRFWSEVKIPYDILRFLGSERIGVKAQRAGGKIENDKAIRTTPIHGVHSTKPRRR